MTAAKMGEVRIGISGWRYAGWRGVFYPEGLRQKDELEFASQRMSAIEINGTFYSLQAPTSFRQWREMTPEGFVFTVKGSRFITHMLRLKGAREAMGNFWASGVLALGEKLGPILWQLPPNFQFDAGRIEEFFAALPRSGEEAAEIGRGHDGRLKHRAWLKHEGIGEIRHALEVRHESFLCEDYLAILRQYNVASVVSDSAKKFPVLDDVTADFVYVRLHGHEQLYSGGYSDALLKEWAARITAWRKGGQVKGEHLVQPAHRLKKQARDVFLFFDNDAKVDAPKDAMRLREMLGV